MGRVLYVVRVMPADSEVDLDALMERIRSSLPEGVVLRNHARETMAFGLETLLLALSLPEEEGVTERVEEALRSVDGVGEIQVEGLTRER
ncbi:MAG: elongation factor 1-beta [Nitrososphaerota archaeon]|nr:elongation factor 1-beta [Candidatus Calditenuis fumarioli]